MKTRKRSLCLALTGIAAAAAIGACALGSGANAANAPDKPYTARYMTNYSQSVELGSGRTADCDSILYHADGISAGQKLVKPTDPERTGYDFCGWGLDKSGGVLWDFETDVAEHGVTLYAKWRRSAQAAVDYTEPKLSYVEKIDESAGAFVLKTVCNQPVSNGSVGLTVAAINRLTANSEDVKEELGYTKKSSTVVKSCSYDGNRIVIEYNDGADKTETVTVRNVSSDVAAALNKHGNYTSTYENKASRYEKDEFDSYGVLLAGSSSMENWSTSTADMAPVTTINHGIGGTTVDHWRDGLAQRLIYPYNPRAVALYLGINNIINAGDSGQTTANKLVGADGLFEQMHERLPDATIYFVLINYVPLAYSNDKTGDIDVCNAAVKAYAADKPWLQLIDAGSGLMKESGKPNTAYFLKSDGLHMTLSGYVIWGGAVKNYIITHEKEIYK